MMHPGTLVLSGPGDNVHPVCPGVSPGQAAPQSLFLRVTVTPQP